MKTSLPPLAPGQALPECRITITQALIDHYAEVSGDFNPIHVDPDAGRDSDFGGTIAHGCIPLEPVFQCLLRWSGADRLPAQTRLRFRYRSPSRPGDTIRAEMRLIAEPQQKLEGLMRFSFACLRQDDQVVIDGECDFPV